MFYKYTYFVCTHISIRNVKKNNSVSYVNNGATGMPV